MTDVAVARTAELDGATRRALDDLCAAAFDEPWAGYWERLGPALHVLVRDDDGRLVAHACFVDRRLRAGDQVLEAAYVEAVATEPAHHGRGFGSMAMRRLGELIADDHPLGALATGSHGFYARLGWETWLGQIWIVEGGVARRMPDEEGHVMVLRTPTTPPSLDLAAPLSADARLADPW